MLPAGTEPGSKDFKDRISPEAVAGLGADLKAAWTDFPQQRFVALASAGLEDLEMKARVSHVADALEATLPADVERAVEVVRAAMASPSFDGWIVFPVNEWVARCGIDRPDLALPLLGELTSRWSAEFAIRPFIEAHPEETFAEFDLWIEGPDEHRRRLVSEGSRPRLPWGKQLRGFIADPTPTIAVLDRLVDDRSAYVRKSVANHLNDIAKDHSELAIATARRWLDEDPDSESRRWITSHGLRTLVKAGDPEALKLLGYDPEALVEVSGFDVSPLAVAIGQEVEISFSIEAVEAARLMIDYAVHHAGSRGRRSPKVFKLAKAELAAGEVRSFSKRHVFREVTVRRLYPGSHLIEAQVNGRVRAAVTVELLGPAS